MALARSAEGGWRGAGRGGVGGGGFSGGSEHDRLAHRRGPFSHTPPCSMRTPALLNSQVTRACPCCSPSSPQALFSFLEGGIEKQLKRLYPSRPDLADEWLAREIGRAASDPGALGVFR
jgi:hypothetical protein